MRNSTESRDWINIKGYRLLSFAKEYLGSKYGQKPLEGTKKSAKDAPKTASETAIQKMVKRIMKAASTSTHGAPSKSTRPAQTDNTLIQPIGISKEKNTYRTKY